MGRKGYDLRGQRFERLYAIEKVVINHNTYWKCQTYKGENHTMAEWSEITGISYCVLRSRINRSHWSTEDALTKPVKNTSSERS